MLSLLAYLWFVVLGVTAWVNQQADKFWFRDHPVHTWAFLLVWAISIGSGEVMFVLRYLV
jgi:cellulose synthase/poly-beta-1,6-N-acetylglucosamine synthase-like glycosyltransferase